MTPQNINHLIDAISGLTVLLCGGGFVAYMIITDIKNGR